MKNKIEYMDAQPFFTAKARAQKLKVLDLLVRCVAKVEKIEYGKAFDVLWAKYPEVFKQFKGR